MNIKKFVQDCIDDLTELINIKEGDISSLRLQLESLKNELLMLKIKRGIYRYYFNKEVD